MLECELNVMMPERPKGRVCYRKLSSINKPVFSADIHNANAVTSGTRIASVDNYNCSVQDPRPLHRNITSRLDYGNVVLYGISDRLLHRLEMVQRSAARVVLRIRRGDRRSMTAALERRGGVTGRHVVLFGLQHVTLNQSLMS